MTEWITPEQAAEMVPFTAEWVRLQLRIGRLEGSKIGDRWLTTQEALIALVESGSNSTRRRRRRRAA